MAPTYIAVYMHLHMFRGVTHVFTHGTYAVGRNMCSHMSHVHVHAMLGFALPT